MPLDNWRRPNSLESDRIGWEDLFLFLALAKLSAYCAWIEPIADINIRAPPQADGRGRLSLADNNNWS